jgi:hypothetical protein
MKTLHTEIEIAAENDKIWRILTDFAQYPQWNPFIKSIEGKAQQGAQLRVVLQPPGGKAMTFTPTLLVVEHGRELCWRGRLFLPGLFDGEHRFRIEQTGKNRCRFVHSEEFSGILVPMLWKSLDTTTRRGFEAMNEALKKRAEA